MFWSRLESTLSAAAIKIWVYSSKSWHSFAPYATFVPTLSDLEAGMHGRGRTMQVGGMCMAPMHVSRMADQAWWASDVGQDEGALELVSQAWAWSCDRKLATTHWARPWA